MRIMSIGLLAAVCASSQAKSEEYSDMAQFAQSICGDIPAGSLSKTTIKGAVEANAGVFARIVSGGADVSASKVQETYTGIPLDKLPDNIPTVAMCKSELIKVLIARKKIVVNTCSHPDFGQTGWRREEVYANSSGRRGGGGDQNQYCNEMTGHFISSRSIGPQYHVDRLGSREESDKDWKGKVTYKYHCTVKVSWDPVYASKQDAEHCGVREE